MEKTESSKNHCSHSALINKFYVTGLVIIWIIFSVAYIIGDTWTEFKVNKINAAINQGRSEGAEAALNQGRSQGTEQAFLQIISLATTEQTRCNVIPLYQNGKIVVQLVNTECVQQTAPPANEEMNTTPPAPTL